MIAVDTNVIVRLLTQDDDTQYQQSLALFESAPAIFIPVTVILETEWVLRFAYNFAPPAVCQALRNLLGLPNVQIEHAHLVNLAVQWHEQGLDFADALHLAQSQNCEAFYTFDDRFIKRSSGLADNNVKRPKKIDDLNG